MRLFAVKVLRLIVVVLVVTFLSFLLIKLLPGDLVDKIIPSAPGSEGGAAPGPGAQQRILRATQDWLRGFVVETSGNYYLPNATPVSDSLSSALPVSLELVLAADPLVEL